MLPPEACAHEKEILHSRQLLDRLRERIETGTDFENIIRLCGYGNIYPGQLSDEVFSGFNGLSLAEGAKKAGMDPLQWLLTILSTEKEPPSMLDFITCEEDIRCALRDPGTAVISDSIYPADGNYHPRVAGTFSRVIEKYVMRESVLSLTEAVRRMTSLPAQRLGIRDRGVLKKGYKADICLFDPAAVKERAEYGKALIHSEGMAYVLINGEIALERGSVRHGHAGQCI